MNVSINYIFLSLFICIISCTSNDDTNSNENIKSLIIDYNRKNEMSLMKINHVFDDCQDLERNPSARNTYNGLKDSIFDLRRTIINHLEKSGYLDKKTFRDYQNNISHKLQTKYKFEQKSSADLLISFLYLMKEEGQIIDKFSSNYGCSICIGGMDIRILSNKDTIDLSDTLKVAIFPNLVQWRKATYSIVDLTLENEDSIVAPFQTHVLDRETVYFYKPTERGLFKLTGKIRLKGVTGDFFEQKFGKNYIVK